MDLIQCQFKPLNQCYFWIPCNCIVVKEVDIESLMDSRMDLFISGQRDP